LYEPNIKEIKKIISHKKMSGSGKIAFVDIQSLIFNDEVQKIEFLEFIFGRYDFVVALVLDCWNFEPNNIPTYYLNLFDLFWTHDGPDYVKFKSFKSRRFDYPLPIGLDEKYLIELRLKAAKREIIFRGGLEVTNYSRLFWAALAASRNSIQFKFSSHHEDGLGAEASYLKYLNDLANTECHLNFARRKDGTKILTGRVHEVISLNRILFNEKCERIGRFYVEGLHYFEFSGADDLNALSDEYMHNSQKFVNVRKELLGFHDSRYSDLKIGEAFAYKLDL
jgi:hypothetical protein